MRNVEVYAKSEFCRGYEKGEARERSPPTLGLTRPRSERNVVCTTATAALSASEKQQSMQKVSDPLLSSAWVRREGLDAKRNVDFSVAPCRESTLKIKRGGRALTRPWPGTTAMKTVVVRRKNPETAKKIIPPRPERATDRSVRAAHRCPNVDIVWRGRLAKGAAGAHGVPAPFPKRQFSRWGVTQISLLSPTIIIQSQSRLTKCSIAIM